MSKINTLFSKTLVYHLYHEFWVRYYFKYVLPKIQEATRDGIKLDLTHLPVKIRNRILNVGYEDHEKGMCRDFLTPQDSILELGGAIGFIGLYCQKILGIRRYVTVEANPSTVSILRRNYELNGLTPVVWNMAVGEKPGKVELNISGDFWENSIVTSDKKESMKTVEVECLPLADLLKKVGHPVNVLVIDIEGAEQYIDFRQMPESIDKVIIEMHPGVIGPEATYDIISSLIVKGFRVAREEGGTFVFLKKPNLLAA